MTTASVKPKGYAYVPAAWSPVNLGGLAVYTRYRRGPDNLELVSRDNDHYRFSTPDRELLLIRNFHEQSTYRPLNEQWDEVSHFSTGSGVAKDLNLGYAMLNYVTFMEKESFSPKTRTDGGFAQDGIKWMSDSGGFQLITQRVDYIDPAKLAHWYNDNVDLGFSLDIPSYPDNLRERAAHVLRQNNEVMLDHLKPHVELINVLHGNSSDINTFYKACEIVHNKKIARMSFGDLYFGTVVDAISRFIRLVEFLEKNYAGHYKHIHILGIFNIRVLLPLIYVMNRKFPHIQFTSDSTTYL